ncbi:adenylate/guanylate cyclase domain-containing protein [Sorangium sp. So ce1000]|uniref:adenylate/guanylate cyclase domain-containing protein n=1 Tax=Sorangium sp. So ce1000 TaxID=3133325 RepID=UPI003F5E7265
MSEERPRVLVVDDTPTNLQVLVEHLRRAGIDMLAAEDGESALSLLRYETPDLILLDVVMPKVNGFEVCHRLKANPATRDIPVIFMTGLADTTDKVRGFEVGGVDYLTKPIQNEELLARVTTHLSLRALQRALLRANGDLERRVAERTAELARLNDELLATNRAYGRFVPTEMLGLLGRDSVVDVTLGDQVQIDMTVLFSDMRGFAALTESMTPGEAFAFTNAYLGRLSPIIRRCGGFIDKYIGDAIMALFPGKADDAVRAAVEMQRAVRELSEERRSAGLPPISMGIGIHTGSLMLGTIGDAERMEVTVISDAVNQASRLERLAVRYGVAIVLSEQTTAALHAREGYGHRFLDKVRLKGKREPVSVVEVFDGDPPETIDRKQKTRRHFEQALSDYHARRFAEANLGIAHVLLQNPTDKAAQVYQHRIAHLMAHGAPPDWTGVEVLTEK